MVDMPAEETVSEAPLSTGWWGTGLSAPEGADETSKAIPDAEEGSHERLRIHQHLSMALYLKTKPMV